MEFYISLFAIVFLVAAYTFRRDFVVSNMDEGELIAEIKRRRLQAKMQEFANKSIDKEIEELLK